MLVFTCVYVGAWLPTMSTTMCVCVCLAFKQRVTSSCAVVYALAARRCCCTQCVYGAVFALALPQILAYKFGSTLTHWPQFFRYCDVAYKRAAYATTSSFLFVLWNQTILAFNSCVCVLSFQYPWLVHFKIVSV